MLTPGAGLDAPPVPDQTLRGKTPVRARRARQAQHPAGPRAGSGDRPHLCPPPAPPAGTCCTSQAIFTARSFISSEIHAKGCFCFVPKPVCTRSCTLYKVMRKKKPVIIQYNFKISDWEDRSCPTFTNHGSAPSFPYTPIGRGSRRLRSGLWPSFCANRTDAVA